MNIIITGANQGIGYHIVEELLARGNNVTVLDLETDGLLSVPCQDGTVYEQDD